MTFLDTSSLEAIEPLPGWHGRFFRSKNMGFGHYEFQSGSSIHVHQHAHEEVWTVVEGELEVTIADDTQLAHAGCVAIVPPNTLHGVKALSDGRAIVSSSPVPKEGPGTRRTKT